MEKFCPTCQRKYVEEGLIYCLADGSFLLTRNELPQTEPSPTLNISEAPTIGAPGRQTDMPTLVLPIKEIQGASMPVTQRTDPLVAQPVPRPSRLPWVISGVLLLLLIVGTAIFLSQSRSTKSAESGNDADSKDTGNSYKGQTTSSNQQAKANVNNAPSASPTPQLPTTAISPKIVKAPQGLASFAENNDEEVAAIDLNGDGQPEYLGVVGDCGSGGCQLGVFQKTSSGYIDLFGEDSVMAPDPAPPEDPTWKPGYRYEAGPQSSNGYLDIVLVWNPKRTDRFKFNGRKYMSVK